MANISSIDKRKLEKLFRMEEGHVLALSKSQLKDFIIDSVERDIESGQYDADDSNSKAKRLRRFWALEPDHVVGKLIYDLVDLVKDEETDEEALSLIEKCSQIAEDLLSINTGEESTPIGEKLVVRVKKDFFVSYNKADKEWAEWIAWVLEDKGHSVVIQSWDFRPGGNFILDMQRATTDSMRTIIVLSDAYLRALYTQPEWAAAFKHDPTSNERKLLPVRIAPCTPEGMLAPLVYVDIVGKTEVEAEELLLASLQERAKPAVRPAFPQETFTAERIAPTTPFPGTSRSE
ncbi:MAG: toll/interleukin-1 receptor domain-containing protein [Cyanobacteria bacterium J06649_4]